MVFRFMLQIVCALIILGNPAWADQFHYHNVVMGDRAMGLGGAFCAVSDDASGLIYNPGGLAFALANDISGSANAYYDSKIVYKDIIGESDFTELSGGGLAPFFGGLQKLDRVYPGLVFAFGLFTNDSELKDQDDQIENLTMGISRFHRTVNIRASSQGFGIAAAKRFGGNISLGISLAYLFIDELLQEYQDAITYEDQTADQSNIIWKILTQNIRQRLKAKAFELGIGTQIAVGGISLGLSIKIPMIISEEFEKGYEQSFAYGTKDAYGNITPVTDDQVPASNQRIKDKQGSPSVLGKVNRAILNNQSFEKPLGKMPVQYRTGIAWFATTRFLWSFDIIHHTATSGDIASYERNAVTNFATGAEYYITPTVPLRMGLFTNYDTRPEPSKTKTDQRDHINYTGGSLFVGWVQPNSQITIGTVIQKGTGKAQKLAGDPTVHTVDALARTVAFAATHSF